MPDSIPRPKRYLVFYDKIYPNAWRDADKFRANRGKEGSPWWPEWCFLPLSAAYAIVADKWLKDIKSFDNLEPVKYKNIIDDASTLAILAAWRVTQGIYRFDPDIYREVVETPVTGQIPREVLGNMPEWCTYIETPGMAVFDNSIAGFFATLGYDTDTKREELLLVLDCNDDEKAIAPIGYSIHLGYSSLPEAIRETVRESTQYWKQEWAHETNLSSEEFIEKAISELEPLVSLLLYLCSANGEIEHDGRRPEKPVPKKTKKGPRLFPPQQPTVWDVGVRMGAAIRRAMTISESVSADKGGTHASPRPHVRRAHWHGYWTGPRKKPEKRKFILKWLSPILVNAEDGEMPVTIRPVK